MGRGKVYFRSAAYANRLLAPPDAEVNGGTGLNIPSQGNRRRLTAWPLGGAAGQLALIWP
jgi:hypothetical protein